MPNQLKIVGAFVDTVVGHLVTSWMAEIRDVAFVGAGSDASEVITLCLEHRPDVVIVGGEFFTFVGAVRAAIEQHELTEPLWIAFVGPPKIYSRERAMALGIRSEMTQVDFTNEGLAAAIEAARHARSVRGVDVRIVTSFPTNVPNATLANMLKPWGEFQIGENCLTGDHLLAVVRANRPSIVAFGHQCLDYVDSARQALGNGSEPEPQWVLLLSHLDPATLVHAAAIGVKHVFTSEQFEPVRDFAQALHRCAAGELQVDSPLAHIAGKLSVASDDDDRKIIQHLVTGATNDEISAVVFLSTQTVKNRLSRMMRLANVSNRTELALLFAGTDNSSIQDR